MNAATLALSESMQDTAGAFAPILLDMAVKGTALLGVAIISAMLCRRAAAATRHLIWTAAILGLLVLPLLYVALPAWRILPAWMALPGQTRADDSRMDAPGGEPVRSTVCIAPAAPPPAAGDSLASQAPAAPLIAGPTASVTTPPAEAAARVEPAALAARPVARRIDTRAILVLAWLAGVAILLLPILGAPLLLWRLRGGATRLDGQPWAALLAGLRGLLGIGRLVSLLKSAGRPIPMTFGILHPVILLPEDAGSWPGERRRMVLLHELAHIQRHDCLTFLVARLVRAVFWFHPLVWYATGRMNIERERACDDLVLSLGTKSSEYAAELLSIASGLSGHQPAAYAALAMARPSTIESRLLGILDPKRNRRAVTRNALLGAMAAIMALAIPVACMRAQSGQSRVEAGSGQAATEPAGLSVDDMLKEVTNPSTLAMNMPASYSEVRLRLIAVTGEGGYRPRKADEAKLLGVMNDAAREEVVRLCAASFLLQLDNEAARKFVGDMLLHKGPPFNATAEQIAAADISEPAAALAGDVGPGRTWSNQKAIFALQWHDYIRDVWLPAQLCRAVLGTNEAEAIPTVLGLVGSSNDYAIFEALIPIRDTRVTQALSAIVEKDGKLNVLPAIVLTRQKWEGIAKVLLRHLGEDAAAEFLVELKDPATVGPMRAYAQAHPDDIVIQRAVIVVSTNDRDARIKALVALAGRIADADRREKFWEGLARDEKAAEAVAPIRRRMITENRPSHDGIWALQAVGTPEAIATLIDMLELKYPDRDRGKGQVETQADWIEFVSSALEKATGQKLGNDAAKWRAWQRSTGSATRSAANSGDQPVLTLRPAKGDTYPFGRLTPTVFVLKNTTGRAVRIDRITHHSASHTTDLVVLSSAKYGSVSKDDGADAWVLNEMAQQATRMCFHRGFLLPGEELKITLPWRPTSPTETVTVSYAEASKAYDGTAASLDPWQVYIPTKEDNGFGTRYVPFTDKAWRAIAREHPESRDGTDILIANEGKYLQQGRSLRLEVPVAFGDANAFTYPKAQAAANAIRNAASPYDLAWSEALGGWVAFEWPAPAGGAWMLRSPTQKTVGDAFAAFPPILLDDLDRDSWVRIRVSDQQAAGAAPQTRLTGRKFWDAYPTESGDGMYTRGEFVKIDAKTLLPFLTRAGKESKYLTRHDYFFESHYFVLSDVPPATQPGNGAMPAAAPASAVAATQPVAIHVAAPEPVASDAATIAVEVAFQNISGSDATVVWEKERSIRVAKNSILVGTDGWGSDQANWIMLKPGEKVVRSVMLQIGQDIPALDPGTYRIALDFKIAAPQPIHLQHEVPLTVTGAVPANSLSAIVKAAAEFYQARKLIPGEDRIGVGEWELTPNMYRGAWQVTFSEHRPGGYRVAQAAVDRRTGKAMSPPPIPVSTATATRAAPATQAVQIGVFRLTRQTSPATAPGTQPATAAAAPAGAKGWMVVDSNELARAEAEVKLYDQGRRFFVHVRVSNVSGRVIGVDLGDYNRVIYPNQWGWLDQAGRRSINERRLSLAELPAAEKARMLEAFAKGALVSLKPGEGVDYFREFNSNRPARDENGGAFLFVSLDGFVLATDGQTVARLDCQWDVDRKKGKAYSTELQFSAPLEWNAIPNGALLVADNKVTGKPATIPAPATQPAIDLGKDKVKVGLFIADPATPAMYAIGPYPRTRPPYFPALFELAAKGASGGGGQEVIARLPGLFPKTTTFEVDSFQRQGQQFTATVRCIDDGDPKARDTKTAYVWAPLPELPPGRYRVQLVPMPCRREGGKTLPLVGTEVAPLTCEFDVADPAAITRARHYIGSIQHIVPKGWTVTAEGDVITITRDAKVRGISLLPGGPGHAAGGDPYTAYSLTILMSVGPHIGTAERQQMAAENEAAAKQWLAEHPRDPRAKPLSPPLKHVLPTHYDYTDSVNLSCWQSDPGRFTFESKEVAAECLGVYTAIESMFIAYEVPATLPATQRADAGTGAPAPASP